MSESITLATVRSTSDCVEGKKSRVLFKACGNKNITAEILKELLGFFGQDPPLLIDRRGTNILHIARNNEGAPAEIVDIVSSALPDLLGSSREFKNENAVSRFIVEILCEYVDGSNALDSLKLLIQVCPESLRTPDFFGLLQIARRVVS